MISWIQRLGPDGSSFSRGSRRVSAETTSPSSSHHAAQRDPSHGGQSVKSALDTILVTLTRLPCMFRVVAASCSGRHLTARRTLFALLALASVTALFTTAPSTVMFMRSSANSHSPRLATLSNLFPSFVAASTEEQPVFIHRTEIVAAPASCAEGDAISFVVIVTSHPGNEVKRNVWRRASPARELNGAGLRRVFLLGQVNNDQRLTTTRSTYVLEGQQVIAVSLCTLFILVLLKRITVDTKIVEYLAQLITLNDHSKCYHRPGAKLFGS